MRRMGLIDICCAALYAWIAFVAAPCRSLVFNAACGAVIGTLAVAGVALTLRARFARALGIAASVLLLAFTAVTVLLFVASIAYVSAIHGPLGQALTVLCVIAASLVALVFGVLPVAQLSFHLRRRG